jgi:hypothetical protein
MKTMEHCGLSHLPPPEGAMDAEPVVVAVSLRVLDVDDLAVPDARLGPSRKSRIAGYPYAR